MKQLQTGYIIVNFEEYLSKEFGKEKTEQDTEQDTEQVTDQVADQVENLLSVMDKEYSTSELMELLNLSHREHFRTNILQEAINIGLVEWTIPDKPTSSRQKYIDLQKKELHIKINIKYHDNQTNQNQRQHPIPPHRTSPF